MRTELVLAPTDQGATLRIPISVTAETTFVEAVAGLPAPAWWFANGNDEAYALVLLDPGSVASLEYSLSQVTDSFQRAMLWGALWDLVREGYLTPDRYIRLALRELPAERDEQIVASVLGRLTRATTAYLTDMKRAAHLPDVERVLLAGASDASRAYGIRKAHLDNLIRLASTPATIDTLDGMLDRGNVGGLTLGPPTRWAIVTRLVAVDAPTAARRLEAEVTRDSTAEGARRAFVAAAARPLADVKRQYFTRYFADAALNEDWATASLDAFNVLESRHLTRPYLRPALDSLAWIQRNRRIFYLTSWIGSFLESQIDHEALGIVRDFLAERTDLAPDLRAKVLQSMDELERAVRIRSRFSNE
jgi:aminopeptidase N